MALAECDLEMLRLSHGLIEEGYAMALADAGVPAKIAPACLWGSIWIARPNHLGTSDRGFAERHREALEKFQTEAEALYRKKG